MKNYKYILEAINRGINLALDDFDDEEIIPLKKAKLKYNKDYTKDYLDLMNIVVDLGLPSGTLWCKYNLGVELDKAFNPKDGVGIGNYYAWGEIELKQDYTWSTYKYGQNQNELTKYVTNEDYIGYFDKDSEILLPIDNITKLLLEDDIAYLNMHIGNFKFHIPSDVQFEELLKYTTCEWSDAVIKYITLTSKVNGNKIIFPACGYYTGKICRDKGWGGDYWSSSLDPDQNIGAYSLVFSNDSLRLPKVAIYTRIRSHGLQIRPVTKL